MWCALQLDQGVTMALPGATDQVYIDSFGNQLPSVLVSGHVHFKLRHNCCID